MPILFLVICTLTNRLIARKRLYIKIEKQIDICVNEFKCTYSLQQLHKLIQLLMRTQLNNIRLIYIIYRPTIRCLHLTLICMILRRDNIGLTLNSFTNNRGVPINYIAFTQNRTVSWGLTLPLYFYLYFTNLNCQPSFRYLGLSFN